MTITLEQCKASSLEQCETSSLEQKRQLAIRSFKEKMINKMEKIKSSDDTIENLLYNVSDEAERNLLRIFNYCHRQFKYFELTN